jgi:hypothetical protein
MHQQKPIIYNDTYAKPGWAIADQRYGVLLRAIKFNGAITP